MSIEALIENYGLLAIFLGAAFEGETAAFRPALARATRLLEKYQIGFILAFRFLVGLRTISPVVIGTTRIATGKFVVLNAVAALVWGQLFTALGYLFGHGIQQTLGHLPLHRHLLIAVAAAAVVAAAALLFRMKPGGRHP
jgi:membrane protein DedA with SNARE-associated domain